MAIYVPGIHRLYCKLANVITNPTGRKSSTRREIIMRRSIRPLLCLQQITEMPERATIPSPTENPGTESAAAVVPKLPVIYEIKIDGIAIILAQRRR